MIRFSLLKKLLIYVFIIINIFTVLFINRPVFLAKKINEIIDSYKSPRVSYKLSLLSWYIKSYAHIVGLDNQWQMFGRQSRFNWWYLIKAKYENSEVVTLPLPRQMPRNLIERNLIDFKEGKFHLILYGNEIGRETYSHYLCRKFSEHNDSKIKSIVFELWWQNILPPKEARKKGMCLDPGIYNQVLNEFNCPEVKLQ